MKMCQNSIHQIIIPNTFNLLYYYHEGRRILSYKSLLSYIETEYLIYRRNQTKQSLIGIFVSYKVGRVLSLYHMNVSQQKSIMICYSRINQYYKLMYQLF